MSEGEGNLDRNMNMTEVKNGKLEIVYPSKDVEQGKRANESSNTPWGRIIAMVIAIAVLVAACAVTWVLISWQIGLIVAAALIVLYVIVFCWKRICIIIKTVPRDLSAVYCYIKILLLARKYTKLDYMIPDILHDVVKRHPNKACFLFEDEVWTFQQVEDFSLRVSAVLKAQGVKRGDIVAVMAILKFTRRPLNTSNDNVRVVESEADFTSLLETTTPLPWTKSDGEGFNGKMLYIYTSGTTGLPKAAVISTLSNLISIAINYDMNIIVALDNSLNVWNDFVKRFGIKKVVEFYGATEGNANIVNIDNKPGAIGFISRIIPAIYPIAIIKVDEDTGEPIRNSKGLCQLAKPYEAGVFIGKIQPNHPSRAFLGYVDKEASEKKIVRNVLKHGDSAFISGDILTSDDLGYLYFRDRTGDTFRWRGENVSTTEVEATISRIANQRDAVVYGVEIPNTEGRAGMCGIVDADDTLDLDKLALDMAKDLPKYARPVFIRIMKTMDMTATFKIRKVDLQKEGYNPSTIADKLYYFDPKQNKYVILGSEDYDKIVSGQIRLALCCYAKVLLLARKCARNNLTVPDIFHEVVQKHPNKACFLFQDEVWTFKEVEDFSLRMTAVMKAQGVKKGSIVGLFTSNCPEMPALWLGNARLGAVTPLINTNQRGKALLHSINVAKCDVLIFSEEYLSGKYFNTFNFLITSCCLEAIQDISSELDTSLKLFKFSRPSLNSAKSEEASGDGIPNLTKFIFMASGMHHMRLNSDDIVYCTLPLYHTAGGVVSVGQALVFGCTVVLKTKFSASQFFPDCAAHYIGEMCRYVLATPPSPADKQHNVRVIFGNGLRPQIWTEFVERFNIKYVTEFYGATEGNANIANTDGTPGAIGFVSRIFPSVYPIAIIKVDQDTGEPVRDSSGLCQIAGPDEPGVFIGKISANNPSREYLGYVDKAASDKKIIPNTEGRAGMCGLVDADNTLDLEQLALDLSRELPAYARPVFLRIMNAMDMTGTYKIKKTDLQKEGFDPSLVKNDKLYYLDTKQNKYKPLGREEFENICNGKIRL
ncbi:unnamed protein product [Leptidea sinapis]|uniref:long-chain-fatty-acid--CoA ligase n=1 Tax=Leptidea sinapis TaxID=189913 RepID=A0A5E4PWA4_9NEOP|nr:unnamed protein product [Leptidea sinapis]